MRTIPTLLFLSLLVPSQAQVMNGSFENNCAFDLTGWNWFCSTQEAYSGEPHAGCYGLALPTSDASSTCFSNGELIGVHTLISGIEVGVPYELSMFDKMSGPNITSDVGIFAMPFGQPPTSFANVELLNTWPAGLGNPPGEWQQELIHFTIPAQFAGMDFYFFIEYSAAPDIEAGMKSFDDIAITDLNTGTGSTTSPSLHHWPDPAEDGLFVDMTEVPTGLVVLDVLGRAIEVQTFHHRDGLLKIDVSSVPPGLCVMLLKTNSGTRTLRFVKT